MVIAVYKPGKIPISIDIYIKNVIANSNNSEIEYVYFNSTDSIPHNTSIVWDPQLAGGYPSVINRTHTNKPILLTIHGTALFSIKPSENYISKIQEIKTLYQRRVIKKHWNKSKNDYSKIITVSNYSKSEIIKHLKITEEKIDVIYHGVNKEEFSPLLNSSKSYLLHISSPQPKKNIDRLIKAYLTIADKKNVLPLKIISPDYKTKQFHPKLEIISNLLPRKEISSNMRNAYAFVFPSLHETFGMPLVEAMSSAVPIISSNTTACKEIVGDNGLLINPRNTNSISEAMLKLMTNKKLRDDFVEKGLKRAKDFTWNKTSKKHINVFRKIMDR